jgi:sec-independent protein translocase protein TatC
MAEQWLSLNGHIQQLRKLILRSLFVIIIGFLLLLAFYQPLMEFLTKQFLSNNAENKISLLIMSPTEGLHIVCKVCFWLSVILTAPIWGFFSLHFLLPALASSEKVFLLPFILCSCLFTVGGILLAHYMTIPCANAFLLSFNESIGENAWTLHHYLDYILYIIFGHAISGELCFLLLAAVHMRILTPGQLIQNRRYVIAAAFILGAILTPPDVLTQIILAGSFICLYEASIGYARWRWIGNAI